MCHNRHAEASSACKINSAQKKAVNHIFQLACDSLIDMTGSKRAADDDQAEGPRCSGRSQDVNNAIHEVASIDHLFTKCGKCPCASQGDKSPSDISVQCAEELQVGFFTCPPRQQRLGDKQLVRFHGNTANDSPQNCLSPILERYQTNISRAE